MQPANADAHLNWGVALATECKYADAVEQFRAVLAIEPENREAASYLERATGLMHATPPGA